MSTDDIKLDTQEIEIEQNKDSDKNKDQLVDNFGEIDKEGLTEIIGLPRLETLIDKRNQEEKVSKEIPIDLKKESDNNLDEEIGISTSVLSTELVLKENSPTSLLEIINTSEIPKVKIKESKKTEEIKSKNIKRRKRKRRKRSDLILNRNNQEEVIPNQINEELITEDSIKVDQISVENEEIERIQTVKEDVEKTITIAELSSFLSKTEEAQEEKKDNLESLIKPSSRKRKKRKRVNRQTEVTTSIKSNISPTAVLETTNNYIFTSVPDNLLNAGLILYNNLTKQMQENGTLRVEYLMTVLGSLSGYSTQASAREKMINRLKLTEEQVFSVIETADGSKYYFGDTIDRTLQKDKHSIWYMAATAAIKLTGKVNTNINEIVRFNIRNLGKKTFGIPRIPKNLRTSKLPAYYVENLWIPIQKGLEHFTNDPLDWPVIFGVAIQRALITTKGVLDPNISLKIILESAVPTSIMEIEPINPNEVVSQSDRKILIEKLRSEINTIMKTLHLPNLPEEQKTVLSAELSEKNEQLYQLLN